MIATLICVTDETSFVTTDLRHYREFCIHDALCALRELYLFLFCLKYTSQHCCDKTMDGKTALYRGCYFRNCIKTW